MSYIYSYTLQHLVSNQKLHIIVHRLSSHVGITGKSRALELEKFTVACCLYVTFSYYSVLYHFLLSFRFSETITWEIKTIN